MSDLVQKEIEEEKIGENENGLADSVAKKEKKPKPNNKKARK